jgi:hypothetical protein
MFNCNRCFFGIIGLLGASGGTGRRAGFRSLWALQLLEVRILSCPPVNSFLSGRGGMVYAVAQGAMPKGVEVRVLSSAL